MKDKIKNTINHPTDANRPVSVFLEPETLISGYQNLPVVWKGNVDEQPIEILQTGLYANFDTIEFKEFPEQEYNFLKNDIITWIGEVLHKYN